MSPQIRVSNRQSGRTAFLRCSIAGLVAVSWLSAAMFGMYILAFYLGAIPDRLNSWNDVLPGLYEKGHAAALLAMSAHLATGAVILALGPVQLIGAIRSRWPGLHRWFGRVYVITAGVAGVGGLGFIVTRGTIGGAVMNAGFTVYGILMIVAAAETYLQARAGRFEQHRAWAIRLFALAIGSWLYRMDYGFWLTATHRLWHTSNFRGPFDMVMSFFFYVPNLIVAELAIRAGSSRGGRPGGMWRVPAGVALNAASLVVAMGTYYFARFYWGPAILRAAGIGM